MPTAMAVQNRFIESPSQKTAHVARFLTSCKRRKSARRCCLGCDAKSAARVDPPKFAAGQAATYYCLLQLNRKGALAAVLQFASSPAIDSLSTTSTCLWH